MKSALHNVISRGVYQMVLVHASSLLRIPYFSVSDKEDIAQELCLFYLEKLAHKTHKPSNDFIFISLKNKALNMLEEKSCYKRDSLKDSSLDEIMDLGVQVASKETLADFEQRIAVQEVILRLNKKEQQICFMIMGGANLEEITQEMHISKHTIYKIFQTLKKYFIF